MNYRAALVVVVLFLQSSACPGGDSQPGSPRPNIIFILTDDQGWGDARFAPNLDKFASQATWLRQFYVAATVCSPSRTAFMTGHYPARHLIHGHLASHEQNQARAMPDWLDTQAVTLPGLLQDAGYATAHFGKWHLGSGPGAPPPSEYGLDVSKTVNANGPQLGDESKDPYFRAKSTAMIVDETIDFIRTHQEQPFYVNVWTLLPHAHLNPTPAQLEEYASLAPSANDEAMGPWMQSYLSGARDLRSQMQIFCASLTDIDTQMGRLFAELDQLGLAENTIVFFSSDNGPEDYRIGNAANAGVGSTGPLRARKRSMYEGGVRTFGLVRWPGKIPAGQVDETSVTGGVDFLPTICRLAGVSLPESFVPDGEDVSDIWLGSPRPRKTPLYWEWLFNVQGPEDGYMPPPLAVRDGDWKLFVDHQGKRPQLFQIPKDPGEQHDVAQENTDVVNQLTAKALDWVTTLPASRVRDEVSKSGMPPSLPRKKAASAKPAIDRATVFKRWDTDRNGQLTLEEYQARLRKDDAPQRFKRFDANGDGVVAPDEFGVPNQP
jgi:arylsulfatase A-like enzyme